MPNFLASEPSAYLKSAAHQPVPRRPWGEAAFAQARAEEKPILLDIGAVWCHWCHVMDGESYENPEVAEILNRDFICIKVDRDERPDVDARYQRAVQALTGQGGWPLTAFLTPDGEVFFGGTYFPPEDNHYGRPGFISVLKQVAELHRSDRARVAKSAQAIRRHVTESLDEAKGGQVTPAILDAAAAQMAGLFDVRYGGFGDAPKFPHPAAVDFLLARWHDAREDWTREVVEKTLTGMAKGGIRDHVGGGFHRYSVDEGWILPHFEKMAYDNSELLRSYLNAYAALGTPLFKEVAAGIVNWVLEVLSDGERGVFFTSQDADLAFGDDGDYWTWTPGEIRAALSDDHAFDVIRRVFDVEVPGEMHHDHEKNVLWWKRDPAGDDESPVLKDALKQLKVARHCVRAHWDEQAGGFFDLARDRPGAAYLATPAKPAQDAPTPSGNGVAALVLARLSALTEDREFRRLLDRQLATFAGAAAQLGLHAATLLRALDWALNPATRVEVSGPRGEGGAACAMHLVALQAYRPRKIVIRRSADQPAATVCVGTTCSLPVATPEDASVHRSRFTSASGARGSRFPDRLRRWLIADIRTAPRPRSSSCWTTRRLRS